MFYVFTVALVAVEVMMLICLRGRTIPFPGDKMHLLKMGFILLCPGLNIFYGIGIIPYFFHPDPYRIQR